MLFDISTRINITNNVVSKVEKMALSVTNNDRRIAGLLIFIIHTFIVAIIFWLMFWNNNPKLITVGLICWIIIMLKHWYFNGCWGVKCERKIWQTKEWYGPWTSLFNILHNHQHNHQQHQQVIFITFAIIITAITITRLIILNKELKPNYSIL